MCVCASEINCACVCRLIWPMINILTKQLLKCIVFIEWLKVSVWFMIMVQIQFWWFLFIIKLSCLNISSHCKLIIFSWFQFAPGLTSRPELYQKSNRSSHSSDTSSAYSGSDTMTSVQGSLDADNDEVDFSGLVESIVDSDEEEDLAESMDVRNWSLILY